MLAEEPDHGFEGGVAGGERDDLPLDDRPSGGRHREDRVPLLSVPESLRSSELGVGVRAVRGLLVLVVAATLVLGGRWLWTERVALASPPQHVLPAGADAARTGDAVPVQVSEGQGMAEEELAGEVRSGGGGPDATVEDLVVHVAGEVAEPGIVTLPEGSRVVDAVRAAGGVTKKADQTTLNLARPVVDGERIWVGRPGESAPVLPGPAPAGAAGGPGAAGAAPLDLNAATQADLEELPGVGPVTAGHILAWREEHGRFSSVDELLEVSGIGERTLAQLEPLVSAGG